MTKNNNTKLDGTEPGAQGPGALLRRTRQQAGIGEEVVCRRIGISLHTLNAIDTDNYQALPSAVFVRGYLRTYCSILKLRASPVLACFDDHIRYLALLNAPPQPSVQRRPYGLAAFVGASLMACSLVTWALYSDSREGVIADRGLTVVDGDKTASHPQHVRRSAADDNNLELRFHGDSWLQVIDANDHILAVDLYRAGSHLALEGVPPFKITLGHAPGVEISYQGVAVDVIPDPDTLAADITVGR